MATANSNLSSHDEQNVPSGEGFTIGIVVSEWNEQITNNLARGARDTLLKYKVREDSIIEVKVPGAFELPISALWLADHTSVDAIVCIGSVIRGETAHFEYVSNAVSQGVKDVSLKTSVPVIFCVLTDDNLQQAIDRSGGKHGNKGVEAAVTALKMIKLKETISRK